jgi:hypothetical protein
MKKLLIGMTLVLGACGLSEAKFNADYSLKLCENGNVCLQQVELEPVNCDATVDGAYDVAEVDCTYDAGKAKECLDAIDDAECDDQGNLIIPAVCADVCVDEESG